MRDNFARPVRFQTRYVLANPNAEQQDGIQEKRNFLQRHPVPNQRHLHQGRRRLLTNRWGGQTRRVNECYHQNELYKVHVLLKVCLDLRDDRDEP